MSCRTKPPLRGLLRVPQAAQYLDGAVSQTTLRQWIWHRRVESVRIGGCVFIPKLALDRMIVRTPAKGTE